MQVPLRPCYVAAASSSTAVLWDVRAFPPVSRVLDYGFCLARISALECEGRAQSPTITICAVLARVREALSASSSLDWTHDFIHSLDRSVFRTDSDSWLQAHVRMSQSSPGVPAPAAAAPRLDGKAALAALAAAGPPPESSGAGPTASSSAQQELDRDAADGSETDDDPSDGAADGGAPGPDPFRGGLLSGELLTPAQAGDEDGAESWRRVPRFPRRTDFTSGNGGNEGRREEFETLLDQHLCLEEVGKTLEEAGNDPEEQDVQRLLSEAAEEAAVATCVRRGVAEKDREYRTEFLARLSGFPEGSDCDSSAESPDDAALARYATRALSYDMPTWWGSAAQASGGGAGASGVSDSLFALFCRENLDEATGAGRGPAWRFREWRDHFTARTRILVGEVRRRVSANAAGASASQKKLSSTLLRLLRRLDTLRGGSKSPGPYSVVTTSSSQMMIGMPLSGSTPSTGTLNTTSYSIASPPGSVVHRWPPSKERRT